MSGRGMRRKGGAKRNKNLPNREDFLRGAETMKREFNIKSTKRDQNINPDIQLCKEGLRESARRGFGEYYEEVNEESLAELVEEIYEDANKLMTDFIHNILGRSVTRAERDNRDTIGLVDVVSAIKDMGLDMGDMMGPRYGSDTA